MLAQQIDSNEFYEIMDEQFYCCSQSQFIYYCKLHGEQMGCQFCEFNPYERCECE